MASPSQSPPLPPSDLPSPPHTSDLSSPQLRPHLRPPLAPPLARPRPQYLPPPIRLRPPPPPPPRTQVFVSFRGELRNGFVSHVVKALRLGGVNVFIDSYEQKGRDIQNLFTRIDNSKVALVIFSDRFSQSSWCLNELVRIDERVKEKKLVVIPVFYRVSTDDVKQFRGKFGNYFVETVQGQSSNEPPMAERWMAAVKSIASKTGFTSEVHRYSYTLNVHFSSFNFISFYFEFDVIW